MLNQDFLGRYCVWKKCPEYAIGQVQQLDSIFAWVRYGIHKIDGKYKMKFWNVLWRIKVTELELLSIEQQKEILMDILETEKQRTIRENKKLKRKRVREIRIGFKKLGKYLRRKHE